jgi:Ca-activated chloride channel family protein
LGRVRRKVLHLCLLLVGFALLLAEHARAAERLMLVLDGSGSMWGEVGGEAKIVTVRRVIGEMIDQLQPEQQVGLIVYGHNEKGNCGDIETVVPVGPLNKTQLKMAINNISPKGMTPIADAVTLAAEALRYTEEKATVVVISDGRESCGKDVCATAERLESTGVEFTAHTISLDIGDEEGQKQLRCLAQYTGGKFLVVQNPPAELAQALQEIRKEVAPEPAPRTTRLIARIGSGDVANGPVDWTIINQTTENVIRTESKSGILEHPLDNGRYEIYVRAGPLVGETIAEVKGGAADEITVSLAPRETGTALSAPASVAAGKPMEFSWRGPKASGDLIFIVPGATADNRYPLDDNNRHKAADGSPARLVAPAQPGTYEVRYFSFDNGKVLARSPLEVTKPEVTLEAPRVVPPGTEFEVVVRGPNAPGDIVFIAPPDSEDNRYPISGTRKHKVADGERARLMSPAEAGTYELRYYSWPNGRKLASRALVVR